MLKIKFKNISCSLIKNDIILSEEKSIRMSVHLIRHPVSMFLNVMVTYTSSWKHQFYYIQPLQHLNHYNPCKLYCSYRAGTRNQCLKQTLKTPTLNNCQCNLEVCNSPAVLLIWRLITVAVNRTVYTVCQKHSIPWHSTVKTSKCLGIHTTKFRLTSRLPTSGSCVTY